MDGRADSAAGGDLHGVMRQLRSLRRAYPRLRVLVTIAELEPARRFARAASTAAARRRFVRSCIDRYVRGRLPGIARPAAGIVDGFDLDWEVPRTARERRHLTLLAREFRRQLDALRPGLLLTAATGATAYGLDNVELPALAEPLDWLNLMGYDIAGSWSPDTRFVAPLRASPRAAIDGRSIAAGVRAYIRRGVPRSKLVLGVPFFGLAYADVAPGTRGDGLGQPFHGMVAGPGIETGSGRVPYRVLVERWAGVGVRHDAAAEQAWRYDAAARETVVYDDPATLRRKMAWVRAASARRDDVGDRPGHAARRPHRRAGRRPRRASRYAGRYARRPPAGAVRRFTAAPPG